MNKPNFRLGSAFLLAGVLTATFAGTSCTAEDELEDLEIEDLEAMEVEDEARSGADGHHDGGHHDGCDGEEIDLWPPNHTWRHFSVEDCLKQVHACDGDAKILYITSDEPVNSTGDGNTAPDIACDKDSFAVRAERKGNSDGRVYDVHIEIEDHHHHKQHVVCEVEVDHDQGPHGDAVDSGDAYTVWCS
jgi:hypothetical protein